MSLYPYHHPQPSAKATAIWCLSSALAIILAANYLLDGPDDMQAAIDQAANMQEIQAVLQARPDLLQALQDTTPGTAQHHAAAADFCHHANGPAARLVSLADGSLACRGKPATRVIARQDR